MRRATQTHNSKLREIKYCLQSVVFVLSRRSERKNGDRRFLQQQQKHYQVPPTILSPGRHYTMFDGPRTPPKELTCSGKDAVELHPRFILKPYH